MTTSAAADQHPSNRPTVDAYEYFRRLSRVRGFVMSHLSDDLSLQEVAKVAHLSPKYFSAYFRQRTGSCFRDWVAELRVERAQEILAKKNVAVARVAFQVGFKDMRTFQRAFKRVTGVTPRSYKKSVAP